MPDGETGVRTGWLRWQRPLFADNPAFVEGEEERGEYGPHRKFRLRDPGAAGELTFGTLGYTDAAIASYNQFKELRQAGVIPSHIRFQFCLPTPLAPVSAFVALSDRALVEPVYQRQMLAELGAIVATIPAVQLAIQWDVAIEVGLLEGIAPTHLPDPWRDSVERLVELGEAVPGEVELGYHLCYGNLGLRHFMEPADLGLVVRLANAVASGLARPLTWMHMPVPRTRDDDAYSAALDQLQLAPGTEVYLGLVHDQDGVSGTERRIRAAGRHLASFGVATECGLSQRPAESIAALLRIHAAVAAPRWHPVA
jgi:hypothetical protein